MASVHNVLIEEWAGLVIGLFTGVLVMVGIIILKPILFEFTSSFLVLLVLLEEL